jgi:ketosteroid isomerase-like protein
MEDQVTNVVQEWAGAEQRGDADFLAQTLADDFLGVGPRGFILTKEQWLARYRSGDIRNESFRLDEMTVRSYGEAAIVVGRQVQQTQYRGQDVSGQFRATLVLVQQAGRWLIAGWQASSPLPDSPPSSTAMQGGAS